MVETKDTDEGEYLEEGQKYVGLGGGQQDEGQEGRKPTIKNSWPNLGQCTFNSLYS